MYSDQYQKLAWILKRSYFWFLSRLLEKRTRWCGEIESRAIRSGFSITNEIIFRQFLKIGFKIFSKKTENFFCYWVQPVTGVCLTDEKLNYLQKSMYSRSIWDSESLHSPTSARMNFFRSHGYNTIASHLRLTRINFVLVNLLSVSMYTR